MNNISIACAAALGFLLFGLGLCISALRFKTDTLFAYSAEPGNFLCKLVRAHGNTAEYAPFIALLILYLGSHSPVPWVVWAMVITTTSRFVLVAGLLLPASLARPNPLRFVGALGTYFGGAALCVALLNAAA